MRKVWEIAIFCIAMLLTLGLIFFVIFQAVLPKEEQRSAKPVIYLYPQKDQKTSVKISYNGDITCTYPEYKNGWNVIAKPDGSLTNIDDKKEYSYLFWEGKSKFNHWDLSQGFVVKREDTKSFLQNKLSEMGLMPKEYNDFIVYWLPQMQANKYNLIHFAGEEYEDLAKLSINPKPDSILRVFMVYKPINSIIKIEGQKVKPFKRKGFCVVEWGGTEIR
jgi:hypothetical protein